MFDACSPMPMRISSPARTLAGPHAPATRLIASVVPRVKATSSGSLAPMKRAIRALAASIGMT